jgi:hypothetical protein
LVIGDGGEAAIVATPSPRGPLVLTVTSGVKSIDSTFVQCTVPTRGVLKGILASGRCWVVQCGGSKFGRRTRVKAGVALGMRLCCYAASAFALRMCSPGSKVAKLP